MGCVYHGWIVEGRQVGTLNVLKKFCCGDICQDIFYAQLKQKSLATTTITTTTTSTTTTSTTTTTTTTTTTKARKRKGETKQSSTRKFTPINKMYALVCEFQKLE